MCDDTTADFLCFLLNGGPFLTTWHIGSSSNFPISVAHKMFKPKPAMHPNEFPRLYYVRPIFFRLCYVLEKKLYAKNAYCRLLLLLLLPMLCAISQNIPPQKKKKRIVGKTTSFRRVEKKNQCFKADKLFITG